MFQKLRQKFILQKIKSYRQLNGWLSDPEALGLFQMAAWLGKNANIVEIGSWQGKSTYCLAKGLKSGKVYAIDPFNGDAGSDADSSREYAERMGSNDLSEIFLKNMRSFNVIDKIVMKKGYSRDFSNEFSSIDALFIDGDHSMDGCTNDFNLYADKIVPGGFLAFHDYYHDRPALGPTYVVDHLVMKDPRFSFYKQYDTLWIAQRSKTK